MNNTYYVEYYFKDKPQDIHYAYADGPDVDTAEDWLFKKLQESIVIKRTELVD